MNYQVWYITVTDEQGNFYTVNDNDWLNSTINENLTDEDVTLLKKGKE